MAKSYAVNKKSIYNWREKNIERSREIMRRYKRRKNAWLKISKEFLQILIEL